ncbi:MAG: helix-hairpin-helix domain-containing protein [Lachnospiraceae bacterium]|nr:helix-hairpin-helix domain-containing protein [Lachnospiraceae bacterium]
MKKKLIIYAGAAALAVLCGFVYAYRANSEDSIYHGQTEKQQKGEEEKIPSGTDNTDASKDGQIGISRNAAEEYGVFVCGQVQKEGVCFLEKGSRVSDAISEAGGFTEEADTTYWNLAAYVYDGQRIYVPKVGEAVPLELASDNAYDAFGRLDLNAATLEQLMELPGIGEKRALDILRYRESIGRFEDIEQLMNVSGIKTSLMQGIRDKICVR